MTDLAEWIGYAAAACTTGCYFPQVWHVVKERKTGGISLVSYLTLFIGIALWTIYGVLIERWPVVIANGITLPLILIVIVMKMRLG